MPIDISQIPSPCFVLEESLLRRNLNILDRVQKESGARIILALKGFAMWSAASLVREYLPGTTASSLHEARLGFEEYGGEVHAYSPAYLDREFDEVMGYCDHITFNTVGQWNRFKPKLEAYKKKIHPLIRINPQYSEVETDLYNPCIPGSRLGITADQLGGNLPEGIEGLHFHTLCEKDSYTLERTLEHVEAKFGHLLREAKILNMGGGHAITRKDYNVDHLIGLIKRIRETYSIEVILEPGSAVGWETGYLLTTVEDIMDSQGIKVAIIDASISAHMPDCIEMPYKPIIWNATDPILGKPTYRFGGLTCLAGDYIGDYSFNQELKIGDKIIFNDMMHYTMVKTTTFNGVNLPNIGTWKEDSTFQLIKTFGYDAYRDRLS